MGGVSSFVHYQTVIWFYNFPKIWFHFTGYKYSTFVNSYRKYSESIWRDKKWAVWTAWTIYLWIVLSFNPKQLIEFRCAAYIWPWQSMFKNVGMKGRRPRSQTYSLVSTVLLSLGSSWPLLPEPATLQRKLCYLALTGCCWLP